MSSTVKWRPLSTLRNLQSAVLAKLYIARRVVDMELPYEWGKASSVRERVEANPKGIGILRKHKSLNSKRLFNHCNQNHDSKQMKHTCLTRGLP